MLNRIIKFSLDNRIAVIVMSIVLLIYGMIVLLRTKVDIFPDLNAPTVVVMTEAPGMAPEEIEKVITYPVETAVNGASVRLLLRACNRYGLNLTGVQMCTLPDRLYRKNFRK